MTAEAKVPDTEAARRSDWPIDPIYLERWSPRAFDGTAIAREDLLTILEAARWAPSAFNYQPWRFVFALNGDEHWSRFVASLKAFNQAWASNASALVFVLSDSLIVRDGHDPTPATTHSFDAGAAWGFLALQALRLGYHTHGMAGIEQALARSTLGIPERFVIEAAVAIGRLAPSETLPKSLREREVHSARRELTGSVFEGAFGQPIASG